MNLLPKNLASLATLCADETTRYSMTGVEVSFGADGTYTAAATNGRYLGVTTGTVHNQHQYPITPAIAAAPNSATNAIIPQDEWLAAFKAIPKQKRGQGESPVFQFLACVPSDKTTLLSSTDGNGKESSTTVQNMEVRFPAWKEVLPKTAPVATVALNPKYLIELLKVALAYTSEDNQRITLELRGKDKPIIVQVKGADDQQFTGLLMPLS